MSDIQHQTVPCACCGTPTQPRKFDHALQGHICRPCILPLKIAEINLGEAGLHRPSRNPQHEK